ncbi:MAG: hypothetical protein IT305_11585 [Chloroflexi bacterium]|nr:hypothetical protein [Chloroflexota bacterium]
MHILLTNDDGITSDGLWAAARGLARVGRVTVLGTCDDWSGAGAAIRISREARLRPYPDVPADLRPNVDAYAIDAAPGGAILVGLMTGLFGTFDLVASGANYGINVGTDIVHSGTVGAAASGFQRGLNAFAISADRGAPRGEPQQWGGVSDVSERVARWLLDRTGPPVLLNVNVPNRPFAAMAGVSVVAPVAWGNLDRSQFIATPHAEGGWTVTTAIDRLQGYPDDPSTDSGAVMAGRIAVTSLLPTGGTPEMPAGLDDLLPYLAPPEAVRP